MDEGKKSFAAAIVALQPAQGRGCSTNDVSTNGAQVLDKQKGRCVVSKLAIQANLASFQVNI